MEAPKRATKFAANDEWGKFYRNMFGVAKMNQVRFHIYTFIGSWPWCYALAYVGMKLGDRFRTDPRFKEFFDRFHLGVELVIVAAAIWFISSHWKNRIRTNPA